VESHFDLPLDQIFRGAGRACRATRGVVMALARFDWGQGRLAFASVGNIEARVFPSSEPFPFSIRRGVIGLNAPNAVVTEHPWPPGHVLVLHSDGLRTHWSWKDFPGLADQPAPALAQEFLRLLAKEEDDATVVFWFKPCSWRSCPTPRNASASTSRSATSPTPGPTPR
jgi:hypothetical protein